MAGQFVMTNDGWSCILYKGPVFVVIKNGSSRYTAEINNAYSDMRTWLPGTFTTMPWTIDVPLGAPTGTYSVGLWLPDPASSLRSNAAYAIRLANSGWASPDNLFGSTTVV